MPWKLRGDAERGDAQRGDAPGQTNGILYAHQTGGDKSLMIIEAQHDKTREQNRIMAIQMD